MGHTVLRLPVAHCELNPIELAWASMKGYVAKHNKNFTMTETKQLTIDRFKHTVKEVWRSFCRHMVDIENEYFEKDGLVENFVEDFTIDTTEYSEEEHDFIDNNDWLLIDNASLERHMTSTEEPSTPTGTTTNARRALIQQYQNDYDSQFLTDVLSLP